MLTKTTKSLFKGIYQYKIVLIVSGASVFRGGDADSALTQLKAVDVNSLKESRWNPLNRFIKSEEDLSYAISLAKLLKKMLDLDFRVESPYISIYSNSKSDIDNLAKLDYTKVKYVSVPPSTTLDKGTVIMPKMNYDYRITLGKTTQNYSAFVEWAETNAKVKLTKSSIRDLKKDRSWGGTHVYITGDKNLLVAKMHLGGSINKIERIVKA